MTSVVVNTRTGQRGTLDEWVAEFTRLWSRGAKERERFLDILSPEVTLIAPLAPAARGQSGARAAFKRIFSLLPDLNASVVRWSATGDALFIEMRFGATLGGQRIEWPSVDRFLFRDGVAIERVAFFDPLPLLARVLRAGPRAWLTFAAAYRASTSERRAPAVVL